MKLGGSLKRRRRGRGSRARGSSSGEGPLGWGRVLLYTGGLAVVGWLIGFGFATRVLFPAPPSPTDLKEVPDLRGLTVAAAGNRLGNQNLTLGDVDSLNHPTLATGMIMGQSPLPGQLAQPQGSVRVTVSLGPESRAIPDVTRLTGDRATNLLQASGFEVSVDSVESDLPAGRVVLVDPAVDSVVVLPARVRITISTGPSFVVLPDLLGMDRDAALATLDSLGLAVSEVEEVFRFGRDQDRVVEQDPPAGTQLAPGSSVRLAVGRPGRGGGP